jgi:hypothetical protein
MNQTTYFRMEHDKKNPFVIISRALTQDRRLSAISIGLMTIILSNSNDFHLNVRYLKNVSRLTRTQFYKAWNELQEYQYVIQKQEGKNSYHYIINENPTIN